MSFPTLGQMVREMGSWVFPHAAGTPRIFNGQLIPVDITGDLTDQTLVGELAQLKATIERAIKDAGGVTYQEIYGGVERKADGALTATLALLSSGRPPGIMAFDGGMGSPPPMIKTYRLTYKVTRLDGTDKKDVREYSLAVGIIGALTAGWWRMEVAEQIIRDLASA